MAVVAFVKSLKQGDDWFNDRNSGGFCFYSLKNAKKALRAARAAQRNVERHCLNGRQRPQRRAGGHPRGGNRRRTKMADKWEPGRKLPMLEALLAGEKLWDIKDKKKGRIGQIRLFRDKICKEHDYMCEEEPADQFHANILLGALNLLDGLLDKNQDVLGL